MLKPELVVHFDVLSEGFLGGLHGPLVQKQAGRKARHDESHYQQVVLGVAMEIVDLQLSLGMARKEAACIDGVDDTWHLDATLIGAGAVQEEDSYFGEDHRDYRGDMREEVRVVGRSIEP